MTDQLEKAKNALAKKESIDSELYRLHYFHLDNIEKLNQDRAAKKEERQRALAHGENVSKLTNALSRIDSKIEESEDALIGIKQRRAELEPEIKKLKHDIHWMELEIEKAKLWKIAKKYNEKAKEISEIVRDFWDLYDHLECYIYEDGRHLRFGSGISCSNLQGGTLDKIPVLKMSGEPEICGSSSSKDYFFNLYMYRNYERSKRKEQKKLEAQRALAAAESPEDIDESDEDEFETEEYLEEEEYSEDEDYDEDFEDDSDAEDSEET